MEESDFMCYQDYDRFFAFTSFLMQLQIKYHSHTGMSSSNRGRFVKSFQFVKIVFTVSKKKEKVFKVQFTPPLEL